MGNPESNKASVRERYDAIVNAIHAVKLGLADTASSPSSGAMRGATSPSSDMPSAK